MNRVSHISKVSKSKDSTYSDSQRTIIRQNKTIIELNALLIKLLQERKDGITGHLINETGSASKLNPLKDIISDVSYAKDHRIKFKSERRVELINDFLKLRDFKALTEKEIGHWLCCSFQGFVKPKKQTIITPKIGFENLRYFIRSIYEKYDGEYRSKKKPYREMLLQTHLAVNKVESLDKHFADKMPKKYPRELEL